MTEHKQKEAWKLACDLYAFAEQYYAGVLPGEFEEHDEQPEELEKAEALCDLLYKPEYTEETKND